MIRKLLTLFCLLSCFGAAAAEYCIRAGAGGANNGSDWDNAFTSIPTMTRGNVYYIASGNYNRWDFSTDENGTNLCTLRRATAASHGPGDGWDNSYTNGKAYLQMQFSMGYLMVDGVYKWGLCFTNTPLQDGIVSIKNGGIAVTNITFQNIECAGPQVPDLPGGEYEYNPGEQCANVYITYFNGPTVRDLTFRGCYIHGSADILQTAGTINLLVEDCILADATCKNWSDNGAGEDDPHNNVAYIQAGTSTTFRYNTVSNWAWSGVYIVYQSYDYVKVYGNVFDNGYRYVANPVAVIPQGGGPWAPAYIYNNTFRNVWWPVYCAWASGDVSLVFSNNIFDGSYTDFVWGTSVHNHNWYSGSGEGESDQILGSGAALYTTFPYIKTNIGGVYARDNGIAQAAEYNTDAAGNVRGEDGAWDLGAYEYSDGSIPTNKPSITSGNATGTNGIAFSYTITASGNPTTFGATNLPAGLSCNRTNGLISGTPESAQTVEVGLLATNDFGDDAATVTFTINEAVGVLSVSPPSLYFDYIATNTYSDLVFTLTNSGSAGTTVSGSFSNVSDPFSIVGDTNYSLETGQTDTITIRYSPTVRGQHIGSAVWTGGGSANLIGLAYPVAAGTNWTMAHSLLVSPMTSNANNYIVQTIDTTSDITSAGQAVFGYRAPAAGTIKLNASAAWTGGGDNSFLVSVYPLLSVYSKNFVDGIHGTNNVWDIIETPVAGFSRVYVHQRGSNGTFELPEFPTNAFAVSPGINEIKIYGREPNAQLRDINIEFTPSGLFISPQNLRIGYGQTVQFYATNSVNGVLSNVTDSATWSSQYPSRVSINPTNGFAEALDWAEWRVIISATWSNLTASTDITISNSFAYPPKFISISFLPDEHDYCTLAWTTVGQCTNILDLRICPTDEIVSFTNSVPSNSYENYLSQWYDVEDEIVWCDYRARIIGGNGLTTTSDWYRVCSGACVPGALAVGTNWLSVYERPKAFGGGMLIAN